MGVYIEYIEWMGKWHIFGAYGSRFYDTEEEAREVYERLKNILFGKRGNKNV